MSKRLFTKDEVKILSKNKYVKKVSSKGITYTDEFKKIFITENELGKFPRQIFEECGFNIEILGMQRVGSAAKDGEVLIKLAEPLCFKLKMNYKKS